eukprot:10138985-Alexandrium_andersonii.AAC.1
MIRGLRGGVLAVRVPDLAGRGVAEYEGGRLKDGRSETGSTDAGDCEHAMPEARSEGEALIASMAAELSDLYFHERPIDEEAVAAMQGIGISRVSELFRDIEQKAGQIRNP